MSCDDAIILDDLYLFRFKPRAISALTSDCGVWGEVIMPPRTLTYDKVELRRCSIAQKKRKNEHIPGKTPINSNMMSTRIIPENHLFDVPHPALYLGTLQELVQIVTNDFPLVAQS